MIKDWLVLGSVAFGIGFSLSLPITHNIKDSTLIGLIAIPAATGGELMLSRQQKRQIGMISSLLQAEVQTLQQQKQLLGQTIANLREQQQGAENGLSQLNAQLEQLQTQLIEEHQQKQAIQQELAILETQKRSLYEENQRVESELQDLRAQERRLNVSLSTIAVETEELQTQLGAEEQQREAIHQEVTLLETQRQSLHAEAQHTKDRLRELRIQEQQANLYVETIAQLTSQKQALEEDRNQLENQLQFLQQQRACVLQELERLVIQKDNLTEYLQQLQIQIQATQIQEQQDFLLLENTPPETFPRSGSAPLNNQDIALQTERSGTATEDIALEAEPVRATRNVFVHQRLQPLEPAEYVEAFELPAAAEFRLANSEHTRLLWEGVILPRWQYPPFLGSVYLPRYNTDDVWGTETILDIVGDNLRRIGINNLEYNRIFDRFGNDPHLNWLKILTLVMSEYAYYAEAEGGFWEGLCNRLQLPYQDDNHDPAQMLRDLARDGIQLLKLPQAVGGYSIVSTFWLQSGIPRRNLNHFTELVTDLVTERGWQYLLNVDAKLLAHQLLSTCQNRYPGRTVLRRFLEYSCASEADPLSGKLLQSIAGVAIALREYDLQPQEVLLSPAQRQEFLLNALPQFNFFLRDWEALIQLLTPRPERIGRNRPGMGQLPLTLMLDSEDLLIQLILPEQTLRHPDWTAGTCFIHEANWQGEISASGQVEVEECVLPIYGSSEEWRWQLRDEQGNTLYSWYLEGISSDTPYLLFDALTGDRLLPDPQLVNSQDIFCFAPTGTVIETAGSIEPVENGMLPCSIQGWQGIRLRLTGQIGELNLQFVHCSISISWRTAANEPRLRGLRMRGQDAPYLEPPILWYPPCSTPLYLTLSLQECSVQNNPLTIRETVTIPVDDRWYAISLTQWLSQQGRYSITLTAPEEEWSQSFEVQAAYQVQAEDIAALPTVQVTNTDGAAVDLPIQTDCTHQFWSTTLLITGLWTLEPVKLLLSNGHNQISRFFQATATGQLRVELSTLHDVLPPSNQYVLEYQRAGQDPQRLVELVENLPLSWRWQNNILEFSGLKADQSYTVHCWNLLLPQQPSLEIAPATEVSVKVSLDLPPSIYYLQLKASNHSIENLGWWCNCDDLYAVSIDTDPTLANYSYAILDNVLIHEFQTAAQALTWDKNWIETIAASLKTENYHFPAWLDTTALLAKLESILIPLNGQWYMVMIAEGRRGDFQDALVELIAQHNLWHLILDLRRHRQRDKRDVAFVSVTDIELARSYISQVPYFERMGRAPLRPEEANLLLESEEVEG